jgi:hypothetical protein
MSGSEQYRVKTEISHLLDKGLSLREKYGGEYGWRVTLRHDEKRKGEVLSYKEHVGSFFSAISSQWKDDRWQPVEIIRQSVIKDEGSPKIKGEKTDKYIMKIISSERKQQSYC